MFGSIYTGMSGLTAFSRGLDVISNNVANLNTPGYKGSDLLFQDLFYRYQIAGEHSNSLNYQQLGSGVEAESTIIVFNQGDIRSTGTDTDVAIDGSGFFVLQDTNGQYFYTRAGQFVFNQDGYLVSRSGGYKVVALDENGNLNNINITGRKSSVPSPTTEISFTNNLSTGSTRHEIQESVFDYAGNEHLLTFTFVNNSAEEPRSWIIEITDENGNQINVSENNTASDVGDNTTEPGTSNGGEGDNQQSNSVLENLIKFQGNGSPQTGFNRYAFSFSPEESDPMEISLNFGEPGSFVGVTSFSGGTRSDMSVAEKDGNGPGSLIGVEFDRDGIFKINYSNGENYEGGKLAIANIQDIQSLIQISGGLFAAQSDTKVDISVANKDSNGQIEGKSIELSNVELTQQFSDLIIVQRGYQASSQILTVANEMIQQLLQSVGGK